MFTQLLFWAGSQGNHENFDPSLVLKKLWLIFMEMKQKKIEQKNSKWPIQKTEIFKTTNFQTFFANISKRHKVYCTICHSKANFSLKLAQMPWKSQVSKVFFKFIKKSFIFFVKLNFTNDFFQHMALQIRSFIKKKIPIYIFGKFELLLTN